MSVSTRITLTHLRGIIKNVFNDRTVTPLGRWKIKDKENVNLVVDYSNEDHCGTCAQYINNKYQEKIDLTEYSKGYYLIKLKVNGNISAQKIQKL